jgi:hypothetical protein
MRLASPRLGETADDPVEVALLVVCEIKPDGDFLAEDVVRLDRVVVARQAQVVLEQSA